MNLKSACVQRLLPAVLLAALTSGCATSYLWNRTSSFQWKPAYVVQVLAVTNTDRQGDAVVVFKQSAQVGNNFFSRDVAWRVSQPPDDLATTSGAFRQLTNSPGAGEPIPLCWADKVPTNATAQPPGYAVMIHSKSLPKGQWHSDATDVQLTIHRDGLSPGPYMLPTSPHPKNTTQRVLLTPLTVVVDVPFCIFGAVFYVALHL